MNVINFILILFGVFFNTIAQLFLKQGMLLIGNINLHMSELFSAFYKIVISPYIVLGMCCYIISFCIWLIVLSKVEVSYAYPLLSIGYIITAIFGYYFWGESLGVYKIVGIIFICIGVGIMFKGN